MSSSLSYVCGSAGTLRMSHKLTIEKVANTSRKHFEYLNQHTLTLEIHGAFYYHHLLKHTSERTM